MRHLLAYARILEELNDLTIILDSTLRNRLLEVLLLKHHHEARLPGHDTDCSEVVVEEGELSKAPVLVDDAHGFIGHLSHHFLAFEDLDLAAEYDKEFGADCALFDNVFSFGEELDADLLCDECETTGLLGEF